MPRFTFVIVTLALCLAGAHPAAAQIAGWGNKQYTFERLDADTVKLVGQVEAEGDPGGPNAGEKLAADEVLWNLRTGEFTATGNVLLVNPTSRLSAERVVFNTKTKRGTFYTASGISQLGKRGQEDITMFGTLEPDVYFYGEVIEKVGEDKYKITHGGFTTCVQPTPRWEVVSSTSTINLHDYAILHNAVMRVKDVPVFYLPWMYFPIQDDGRATGFLMPTYGNSTIQGQSLSNAFFWAIDRSQDLTLVHDSFFSRGQGYGTDYRYVAGPASNGEIRFYRLATDASVIENGVSNPSRRSYEVRGSVAQVLPYGLRARGRVDYFSDLTTQQLYNQNPYAATQSARTINGSVSGAWGGLTLTGNYQRSEQFYSATSSILNGYTPSIQSALSSRRIAQLPLYYSLTGEFANVVYASRNTNNDGTVAEVNNGLNRIDFQPSLRAPLLNLPFLSMTTSVLYRYTRFSESLAVANVSQSQVEVPLIRNYGEFKAELLGPTFSKVYNPNNAIASRLKHIIEPNFSIQRTTAIDNQPFVPQLGVYDTLVGNVTRITYGVTNRIMVRGGGGTSATTATTTPITPDVTPGLTPATLLAPTAPAAGARPVAGGSPRELLTIGLAQSYYTDALASKYDQTYQSSFGYRESKYSPIALNVRAAPNALTSSTLRIEYDYQEKQIQGISAQGGVNYPNSQVTVGWSRRRLGSLVNTDFDQTLNAATTLKFAQGRIGGTYAMDWDIFRSTIIQQRWIGFYSAQCCGITVEYQEYNYPNGSLFLVPQNRRFNIGFTLAGIGTFSNFMGAFGGNTMR